MFLVAEAAVVATIPKNVKKVKNGSIRMEAVLQTANDINRNNRRYNKGLLESGIIRVGDRITEGTFFGELDHPISSKPARQFTVLFKNISHRIMETGWDGNKLVGIVETVRTPKGRILKNLAEDHIPIGFSMRGMGDLKPTIENGKSFMDVIGPLNIITWDAVTNPSHSQAKTIRITEDIQRDINEVIHECTGIEEFDGFVKTSDGILYLANDFDELVERRVINLVNKFKF
jgi:hypothetical protein